MTSSVVKEIQQGNIRTIARAISKVENESDGFKELLQALPQRKNTGIIGITGPPGACIITLVDALI